MIDFGPVFDAVLEYIPENDRPDMSSVIQYFNQEFAKGTPGIVKINGRTWMTAINEDVVQWVYDNWKPQKNDVIISSFPKTGTTWVRNIVNYIINKDDERIRQMVRKMTMPHLYFESGLPKKFEMLDKLPWKQKILSTHLPVELVNMERIRSAGAKIICTIRNPKDVSVSAYHMMNGIKQFSLNWKEWFEIMISGEQTPTMKNGEWYADHLLGWYKHKDDGNVLFVVYENLKKNPKPEIDRIAKFLEVDLTDEELSKLVVVTSFKAMKSTANYTEKQINFFRKGEIGSWKDQFTVAQSELMDEKVNEKLSSTDICFIYE